VALRRYGRAAPVPGDLIGDGNVRPSSADGRGSEPLLLPAQDVAPVPQPTQQNEGILHE
jgi:hypothetical protein